MPHVNVPMYPLSGWGLEILCVCVSHPVLHDHYDRGVGQSSRKVTLRLRSYRQVKCCVGEELAALAKLDNPVPSWRKSGNKHKGDQRSLYLPNENGLDLPRTALIDSVCLIGRSTVAMVVNSAAGTYSASSYRNDDRQLLDIHSSSCELIVYVLYSTAKSRQMIR